LFLCRVSSMSLLSLLCSLCSRLQPILSSLSVAVCNRVWEIVSDRIARASGTALKAMLKTSNSSSRMCNRQTYPIVHSMLPSLSSTSQLVGKPRTSSQWQGALPAGGPEPAQQIRFTLLLPYPGGHWPRPASRGPSNRYFYLTSGKRTVAGRCPVNSTKAATVVCQPSGTIVPLSPPSYSNKHFKPHVSLNPHTSCGPFTKPTFSTVRPTTAQQGPTHTPMTQEFRAANSHKNLQCHGPSIPPSAGYTAFYTLRHK
jgi:hypothetical protein